MKINPYVATTTETADVSNDRFGKPSVSRGLLFGLVGYFAPLGILIPLFWIKWGKQALTEERREIVDWHFSPDFVGFLFLAPHFVCLILFAIAGYQRPWSMQLKRMTRSTMGLALATLLGYFVMLALIYAVNPLPWTWPLELRALLRFSFVALFPSCLLVYQILASRQTVSAK